MTDYHIREAAESLLGSASGPRYSRNLSHSQSINHVTEDLVAGHRPHGRMSTVRRFFCLFVTFDLLFTSLMWLICVVMRGETLQQIFDREIIHYNLKSSLFDIVLMAITRFVVLLLFYGVLYINNWSVIALSTSGTCAFLIAKVFFYDWPNASDPVYQVFLILTSFTLSWGEAWFLDFRVLPQEQQAKDILEVIAGHSCERTPLLPPFRGPAHAHAASTHGESTVNWFSPVDTPEASPRIKRPGEQVILTQEQLCRVLYGESTVNWFSPVDTPEASPRIKRPGEQVILTQEQIDEYIRLAEESLENSWRVVNLPSWRVEKKGSKGDIVESKHTEDFGKVYRFTGVVECPAKFLFDELKNNIVRLPEWNPTILKSELIKPIADGIDLSYQVTAGGGRGVIAPRDFVNLRRLAAVTKDGAVTNGEPYAYVSSGVSVTVPGYPPQKDMVRGHNKVGCWVMRPKMVQLSGGKIEQHTVFQWLMCCDLKGKIPQFVLDAAFSTVMLDYIVHVRKFAADARAKGLV